MIVDLFAGPGGWSQGLRMLNPELVETEIGFEWDTAACDTRAAAGFNTIQTDIAQYPLHQLNGKVTGLIASPPCQDFSLAGKRAGVDGDRGQLIGEVLRWVDALQPNWVACEQVPPALPVWRDYAETLRGWGFHVWCGILNAANYGVPQSRRRAFLIASKHHQVGPPEPTHDESPEPSLFGDGLLPWVSMSESIGAKYLLRSNQADPSRPFDERGKQPAKKVGGGDWYFRMPPEKPCWTLTSNTGAWRWESPEGDIKITVEQALILQSFPAAYPLQGSKTKQFEQVGNAVPPRLAMHVLAMAMGVDVPALSQGPGTVSIPPNSTGTVHDLPQNEHGQKAGLTGHN